MPTWYMYLDSSIDDAGHCMPTIAGINDIWLIVAAIIEILLRIAVLVAVMFIIYGGFKYITSSMTSSPMPEELVRARRSIINALVGLVIAMIAAGTVQFIAGGIN